MAERRAISRRLRFVVFERDGFACRYCGGRAPEARLELDHIVPVAEGGTDDRGNLVTSCSTCNSGKAAMPLALVPPGLEDAEARIRRIEAAMWAVAGELFPGAVRNRVKRDWMRAIVSFSERLPLHAVRQAAALAYRRVPRSRRRRFFYFCKVCWNRIRESAA